MRRREENPTVYQNTLYRQVDEGERVRQAHSHRGASVAKSYVLAQVGFLAEFRSGGGLEGVQSLSRARPMVVLRDASRNFDKIPYYAIYYNI